MTAAYTAEEASVQTASRPGSPVGNSSDSDADAETGPALTSSSPAGNAVPLRTSKQQRRAVNSQLRICQERLMNTEVCDNGGSHKLTKACGGLFVYLPSPGKMTAAATSKLDSPFRQRGCLSLIDKLAEEHAWSADGSQSDPSLFAIVQALLTNMLGTVSQQPDLLPMSGSPEDLMDSLKKTTLKDAVLILSCKPPVLKARGRKKAHQFKGGNPPPWWPESVPFLGYSDQTKQNLKLLLTALLSLAKEQTGLHHDLQRVLWGCRNRFAAAEFTILTQLLGEPEPAPKSKASRRAMAKPREEEPGNDIPQTSHLARHTSRRRVRFEEPPEDSADAPQQQSEDTAGPSAPALISSCWNRRGSSV
ncbi:hypothetical protein ABBQ38_002578 [Trebouxia sp. C0009 RCD-2024]